MNNLIYMESQGDVLETLLENQDNEYVVSNNFISAYSRIDLDERFGVDKKTGGRTPWLWSLPNCIHFNLR